VITTFCYKAQENDTANAVALKQGVLPCVQHVMKPASNGAEISLKASISAAIRSMQMFYDVCQAHDVSKKAA
jgi:hypothetical protein